MQRLVAMCLVVLLGIPGIALALTEESFRASSTGGLLEDDFDLLRDPARITEIDGRRIWTNLSNFVNQSEGVFDGASSDVLLVGGAMSRGPLYGAFVYDRMTRRTPLDTGLDDRFGSPLFGDGEVETSEFFDLDGHGGYDLVQRERERRESSSGDDTGNIFAAAAQRMGDARLGVAFSRYRTQETSRNPGGNQEFEYTETNLITDELLYSSRSLSTAESVWEEQRNGVLVSWWQPVLPRLQGGARIGIERVTGRDDYDSRGDGSEDRAPGFPGTNDEAWTWSEMNRLPTSGWNYHAGATGFYEWSPRTQARVHVDVARESFEYTDDALMGEFGNGFENNRLGSDIERSTYDAAFRGAVEGDGSSLTGSVFGYAITKLANGATFAMGLRLGSTTWDESRTTRYTNRYVSTYDDGDGVSTSNDYVYTEGYSQTLVNTTTGSTRIVSVPVGLEFNLRGPVMLRLGAVHTETFHDETTTDIQSQYSDWVSRTDYGDGTFTENLDTSDEQFPGSSVTRKTRTSETVYGYGLGVQLNENLQIDVKGFSDVTDLSDWQLSAVIELR